MFEKVFTTANLFRAYQQVKSNGGGPGIDGQTIKKFEARLEDNLRRLQLELMSGNYRPLPGKRVRIPKPGKSEKRLLVISAVRDRVVQAALYNVLGPLFEAEFHDNSFGFRPGRGCHNALKRVIQLRDQGFNHVLEADIKNCFGSIPHDPLMQLLGAKIRDQRVLKLLRVLLEQGVMEQGGEINELEAGTPQGAVISPLLCNIYLNPLDHLVAGAGFEMVRYADDFLIMCCSRQEAERALALVRHWMEQAGLSLHPDKTGVVDLTESGGLDFLGYRFRQGVVEPRAENVQSLTDKLWKLTWRHTKQNPAEVVAEANRTLKDWLPYFCLSNNPQPFTSLDDWIRKRIGNIRSLRRGRNKCPGTHPLTRELFSLSVALEKTQTAHLLAAGH